MGAVHLGLVQHMKETVSCHFRRACYAQRLGIRIRMTSGGYGWLRDCRGLGGGLFTNVPRTAGVHVAAAQTTKAIQGYRLDHWSSNKHGRVVFVLSDSLSSWFPLGRAAEASDRRRSPCAHSIARISTLRRLRRGICLKLLSSGLVSW